jgi:hypothetical protein
MTGDSQHAASQDGHQHENENSLLKIDVAELLRNPFLG